MKSGQRLTHWLQCIADLGYRRPYIVIGVAALLTATGAYATFRLRVDQDLKALLPADHASVMRLDQLQERIGAQSDFIVAIRSPDRTANLAFARALASQLRKLPALRYVVFERDITFFRRYALLYLPLADLLELRDKVVSRIRREIARKVVLDLDDEQNRNDEIKIDEQSVAKRFLGGAIIPTKYLEADKGHIVVVKARPVRPTTDVAFARRLVAEVEQLIATLHPHRFHPDLQAAIRGEYASRARETRTIGGQIALTAIVAAAFLLAVIALFYRQWRAPLIVLFPIVVATAVTMGGAALLLGTVNIVTAFIFAILLGLGVDYGIHLLSRYHLQRAQHFTTRPALAASLRTTGPAVITGALTTAAVFWLLCLGSFRGFSQFGAVAGAGVLLGLVASLFLVPAGVSAMQRWTARRPHALTGAATKRVPQRSEVARTKSSRERSLAWVIVALSIVPAAYSVARVSDLRFETDFKKLGPLQPANPPKGDSVDYRDAVGKLTTFAPAVALCESSSDCAQVTQLLEALRLADDTDLAALDRSTTHRGHRRPSHPPAGDHDPPPRVDRQAIAGRRVSRSVSDDPFARVRQQLAGGKLLPEQRQLLLALGEHRIAEMRHFLRGFLGLQSFVPAFQRLKLQIIADMRDRIDRKRFGLAASTRRELDRWYRYLTVTRPVTIDELPPWLVRELEQTDGTLGRFVLIWNGGSKTDYTVAKRLYNAFRNLPLADGKRSVPVAANYFILVDVMDTLKADAPVVLGAAAGAVFLALVVMFRSVRVALLVLLPLAISGCWLLGTFILLDWKLNLYSVVALPLLIGLAIDNGVHVYDRWQAARDVRQVLHEIGKPVALSSITTFIGFAGLIMANHVGIKTLGLTAAVGILLALIASLVTLPALLSVLQGYTHRRAA